MGTDKAIGQSRVALLDQLAELPESAVCSRCKRTKEHHGKMGFACMPPFHGRFEPGKESVA